MRTRAFFCGLLGVHLGGVVAERGLEIAEAIVAQLGAVADKEGAAKPAGFEELVEQDGGDAGLAAAGGDGEQDARGLVSWRAGR